MPVTPVREKLLTFRFGAVVMVSALALVLGACRSPDTTTASTGGAGGATTTAKAGAPAAPTTKAKKAPGPFAKACASVASFQYFNHMPDSGKPKNDPIANDPAAVQKKLKEIGDTITKAVPDLGTTIQSIQTARAGSQKPEPAAWTAASTKLADWSKANC